MDDQAGTMQSPTNDRAGQRIAQETESSKCGHHGRRKFYQHCGHCARCWRGNCQAFVDNYNLKKSSYSDTRDLTYCLEVPKLWGSDHESYGHESMPYFDGIEPSIDLEWTHDDKLWRVQITDTVPKGILKSIAFKQAFAEAFPGIEIQESSSTSQYGTTNRLTVVYIDSTVSDQSVSFYKNEYLNELKNKQ